MFQDLKLNNLNQEKKKGQYFEQCRLIKDTTWFIFSFQVMLQMWNYDRFISPNLINQLFSSFSYTIFKIWLFLFIPLAVRT